jgi:3alpha(or 20beta)-hydroxysteroid dehydrogenase
LLQAGGGVIVNMASLAAITGQAHDPIFAASSGGVLAFSRSLGTLLAGSSVRVCCVCPALVDTPMVRGATDPAISGLPAEGTPLAVDEVADAVLYAIRDDTNAGKALRVSSPGERTYL